MCIIASVFKHKGLKLASKLIYDSNFWASDSFNLEIKQCVSMPKYRLKNPVSAWHIPEENWAFNIISFQNKIWMTLGTILFCRMGIFWVDEAEILPPLFQCLGFFFLLDALKRFTKKTQEDFLINILNYLNLILNFSRSSSIVTLLLWAYA